MTAPGYPTEFIPCDGEEFAHPHRPAADGRFVRDDPPEPWEARLLREFTIKEAPPYLKNMIDMIQDKNIDRLIIRKGRDPRPPPLESIEEKKK